MDVTSFILALNNLEQEYERRYFKGEEDRSVNLLVCYPTRLVEIEDVKYNPESNSIVIFCDW